LVETRLCGEDSQALEPEDLVSCFAQNGVSVCSSPEDHNEESVDAGLPTVRRHFDGEISTSNGDIKRELEALVKQHQEDIENQHRKEESASSELIRQLQVMLIKDKTSTAGNMFWVWRT
jgi:hypothetical protein